LIYPSADMIEDKIASRYSLVVVAAKRAKQIKEGSPVLIDTASTNPLTIALEEIAAGKVSVAKPTVGQPVIEDDDEVAALLEAVKDGNANEDREPTTAEVLAALNAAGE